MLKELQGDRFGRLPLAPPVSPETVEQEQEVSNSHDLESSPDLEPSVQSSPETAHAPKVIVFKRYTPENWKLQNEPEPAWKTSEQRAMCA